MSSFNFVHVKEIAGLILIESITHSDERGYFMETYRSDEFEKAGIKEEFVQDNHSMSVKDVIRGLHYQVKPHAQSKLVRCIRGEIYDVAVDLRRRSKTFGKWLGVKLSSSNKRMLYIPSGFAHGFATISDEAEVVYKVDELYSREDERGLVFNDSHLAIDWKIEKPIVSSKDRALPAFNEDEEYF